MADKVCIQPCNGLLTTLGTVVRQASYMLHEDLRPAHTVLGCNPALYHDVAEDIHYIEAYPVLAIEGCKCRCASRLVQMKGQSVATELYVPGVLAEAGLDLSDECREQLSERGNQAVELVAQAAAQIVDRLLIGQS